MVAGSGLESTLLLFHLLVKRLHELFSRVYTGYLVRITIGEAGFVGQPWMGSRMKLSDALWLPGSGGPWGLRPRSLGPLLGFGTRLGRRWMRKGRAWASSAKWAVKAPGAGGGGRFALVWGERATKA